VDTAPHALHHYTNIIILGALHHDPGQDTLPVTVSAMRYLGQVGTLYRQLTTPVMITAGIITSARALTFSVILTGVKEFVT